MDAIFPRDIVYYIYRILHKMKMKQVNNEYNSSVKCELHENHKCQEEYCNLGIFIDKHLYNWRTLHGNPSAIWIFNKNGNTNIKLSKNYWCSKCTMIDS